MARHTRIPFWTTAITTVALMGCLHAQQSDLREVADDGLAPPDMDESVVEKPDVGQPIAEATETRSTVAHRELEEERAGEEDGDSIAFGLDAASGSGGRDGIHFMERKRGGARTKSRPVGGVSASPPPARPRPTRTMSESVADMPYEPVYLPEPEPTPPPVVRPIPTVTNSEHYTDYGVNGFTIAQEDHLSTFAVDVDTASYAMTRRKLTEGYLPPAASVRVEEFVNYFPYEYQRPRSGDPFAVDFEAAPNPWSPNNHIVRIGVQGKKVAYDESKSVHLTFLVDVSGSMRSRDKLELLKRGLIMLTEELEDGDTVAIATYAGATDIVLDPTPISRRQEIIRSLDRLTAGGSTAMSSGIDLAYRLADASYVPGAVNRVFICSDGDANVGSTSHEQISTQIRGYAEKGISLTTLGFGTGNYQDTMMERLANDGDGNYFYIDSEMEARRVLVDKLTGTLEIIAKDVKIQVDWNPGAVIAYRLIGYENRDVADKDFRNDKVDAGEIGAGHQVTAIYEVALRDDPTGNIAIVRVRNKAPGPDTPAVERSFALPVSTLKGRFDEGSDQFRIAFAAASFAEVLRGSPHLNELTLRDVERVARGAQRPEYPEDAELVRLIGRAADLRGETAYSSR
ncbi:MAG: von Willebrand factor type A domain-containing protein [Deltaproteobacteria bacterium]|nr:von Willebrand factor type A domain-containing protein [Deltaproteobacteria bacterium]